MTLENQNTGSEYGIEKRSTCKGISGFWYFINKPGNGYDTYEDAYQTALVAQKRIPSNYRIVVYDYNSSKRRNVRIITIVTSLEPWIEKAMDEMIDIVPTGEDKK